MVYQAPIVIVSIVVSLFFAGWSLFQYLKTQKELLKKDLQNIEKHLTNHVTDTEKEIKELKIDINAKFDKIESTMNAKFDKVDSRLDSLFVILSKNSKDSDKK